MSDLRSLVISSGTLREISNTDTLIVGAKVDAASSQTLTVGGTNATGITIGKAGITTNFPGPVTLTGNVTTVAGTTFTTDVTFGDANTDTVTFVAKVNSNLNFAGGSPTYKITNLANGTNPNDAVNYSQLSAIVSGVSSVTASAPLASSGGATPNISLTGIIGVTNGGTGTSTAFTTGSVVFAGASGVYSQDNANLFWNDVNNRLGIGTATPTSDLEIRSNAAAGSGILVVNTNAAGTGSVGIGDASPATIKNVRLQLNNATSGGLSVANRAILWADSGVSNGLLMAATGGPFLVSQGGVAVSSERLRIDTIEVVLNDQAQNIDFRVEGSGARPNLFLVDAGTARVGINRAAGTQGATLDIDNLAVAEPIFIARDNGTAVFTIADGGNVGIGTSVPTAAFSVAEKFRVDTNGRLLEYNDAAPTDGQLLIGDTAAGYWKAATLTAGTGVTVTNGAGTITLAASGTQSITTINTATTLGSSNYTVLCNGTFTVTLPAAASHTGRVYNIKNIGLGTVTVDGNASETIDGALTYALSTQYESVTIQCDGAAWYIL